jgi:hypothetical protein
VTETPAELVTVTTPPQILTVTAGETVTTTTPAQTATEGGRAESEFSSTCGGGGATCDACRSRATAAVGGLGACVGRCPLAPEQRRSEHGGGRLAFFRPGVVRSLLGERLLAGEGGAVEAIPVRSRADDRPLWDVVVGLFAYGAILVAHRLRLFPFLPTGRGGWTRSVISCG